MALYPNTSQYIKAARPVHKNASSPLLPLAPSRHMAVCPRALDERRPSAACEMQCNAATGHTNHPIHCQPTTTPTTYTPNLVPGRARRLLILPQAQQNLAEPRLLAARRPALAPLPTQIDQLRDALPARASRRCVVATCQELLGLLARLVHLLVLLVVVVLVEVVDVLPCLVHRLRLALCRHLVAVLYLQVASLAPFADHVGLGGVGARGGEGGCGLAGEVGEGGTGDGAARGHVLWKLVRLHIWGESSPWTPMHGIMVLAQTREVADVQSCLCRSRGTSPRSPPSAVCPGWPGTMSPHRRAGRHRPRLWPPCRSRLRTVLRPLQAVHARGLPS